MLFDEIAQSEQFLKRYFPIKKSIYTNIFLFLRIEEIILFDYIVSQQNFMFIDY